MSFILRLICRSKRRACALNHTVLTAVITPFPVEVLEACSWERLEAECPSGQVILLDQARYGRLHLGKCVKQNFGFLGCVADVRSKIDPLCSGRTKCSLDVYQTLQNERPEACSELEAFLQIEYKSVLQSMSGRPDKDKARGATRKLINLGVERRKMTSGTISFSGAEGTPGRLMDIRLKAFIV
ncbi:hypothetical protein LSH36_62g01073 [Paralvinella palmiformis]|uniref:SUEL-type lectin domain-containing protein n=1 Tax=Paralvinella palmiformis TaxID=53620 RepID=A0AAD9K4S7_9ANNE|nr:hypothetical protein LSH36_62g01073 [Paralvinella palmiformis]